MIREEIKNKVIEIVASKTIFPDSEISESTRFKADLGTDSLDDVELLMEFERVFGIHIPDEETMGIVTVGDVINGLVKKLGVEEEVKENPKESDDERKIDDIIGIICDARECSKIANIGEEKEFDSSFYDELVLFLKEHFRSQTKQEWSDEDERMLKAIIGGLSCIQKAGCERFGGEEMSDVILWIKNRFKSLRPQPHWKPSEEQMEALSDAYVEASTFKKGEILESLYNDLQKL